MLNDQARIQVMAGNGGRGVASFRREKFVPLGGPDGGDGGRGGNVYLRVDPQLSTLTPFRYQTHFRAGNGQPGRGRKMHGKQGDDLYVAVPPGTIVLDDETGEPIVDLVEPGQSFLIARGGQGGLGNTHFVTSTRQAPRIAELGEPGEERWVRLELKLIADVGLVGFPNAGKSTLLAASSAARPKIADYPFTTIEPVLGVVEVGGVRGETFVMADIPGLIEGAAQGVGLGHEFLRHVERTRLLVHVIDGSGGLEGRDPVEDFLLVDEELKAYSDELAEKPRFLAINKLDLQETRDNLAYIHEQLTGKAEQAFEVSGVTGDGVQLMLHAIADRLRDLPRLVELVAADAHRVYTLDDVDESHWEIERLSEHHYQVTGVKLERYMRMTDFTNEEAADRFQRILEGSGVSARLDQMGVQPGDVIHIGGADLIWDEASIEAEAMDQRRKRRRTRRERLEAKFGDGPEAEVEA
ncbi:MAG TPA: GTPase ObgE [Thermomicrobiales bacterium]|nr:GTPase ObgE [Thermomicrobiales bacterium]